MHCWKHRESGATTARGLRCQADGCTVLASFGSRLSRTPLRCRRHRYQTDVDTRHATCSAKDCLRRAYYGAPGEGARTCLQHKLTSYVDVTSKRCEARVDDADGSSDSAEHSDASRDRDARQASGLEGASLNMGLPLPKAGPPAIVIGNKHRQGMCRSQANFGDISEGRKRFCARHRRASDVSCPNMTHACLPPHLPAPCWLARLAGFKHTCASRRVSGGSLELSQRDAWRGAPCLSPCVADLLCHQSVAARACTRVNGWGYGCNGL